MPTKLQEAGKAISAANQKNIRSAVETLLALLDAAPDGESGETPITEAAALPVKIETIDDVRAALQVLIDYLPPKAREQLEGDGDGDNDSENAVIHSLVGDTLLPADEAAVVTAGHGDFIRLIERDISVEKRIELAKAGKAIPVKNDKGEIIGGAYPIETKEDLVAAKESFGRNPSPTVKAHINKMARSLGEPEMGATENKESMTPAHMASFLSMDSDAQKNHLTGTHEMNESADSMKTSPTRSAAHNTAHGVKATESLDDSQMELTGEFIRLDESAIGRDGTMQIKLIAPGWGSKGHYSKALLERDGPKQYHKGLKMFWNHPTEREERERPERDLRDVAAVFETDATYLESGPKGPGLYAHVRPMKAYKESIEELSKHIGVSINSFGQGTRGEIDGKVGPIVEKIVATRSVDFVTEPGAGGQILQLFESARPKDGQDIVPVVSLTEAQKIEEDRNNVATDIELKEARTKLTEAQNENKKLRERILLRDAKDMATDELAKVEGLPAPTLKRLAESLSSNPPYDEDGDLDRPAFRKQIKESVRDELSYIESLRSTGRVRGVGGARNDFGSDEDRFDDKAFEGSLTESLGRLGLDEGIVKEAVRGR